LENFKIHRIQTVIHDIHLTGDFKISRDVMPAFQQRVFVKIETKDGVYGLGEAAPLPFFNGEHTTSIKKIIDDVLAPKLIGASITETRKTIKKLNDLTPLNYTAKSAIETAIWDLAGKVLGLPVYQLLGGKSRNEIKSAYGLSLKSLNEMIEEAQIAVKLGFETLKVKLTCNVLADVEMIKQIRLAVPESVKIRVDANAAYSLKDALQAAKRFVPFQLEYFEQPCSPKNIEDLKKIKEYSEIPIAADESILSVEDAIRLIKYRAADHFVIKLVKVGGILPSLRIADLASLEGIPCTIVSPLETSIGTSAGIQLAMVIDDNLVDHELDVSSFLKGDIAEGHMITGNSIRVNSENGLGIDLIKDVFEQNILID
jgi:L-Ala-D/L-Glu epimerase